MASTYQVAGYQAYVREIDEPLTEKFTQYIAILAYSASNTQETYDLGAYVAGSLGTFWTAAIADTTAITVNVNGVPTATTQGALATAALQLWQAVAPLANSNPTAVKSPYLLPLVQGTNYNITLANNAVDIAFLLNGAPTTPQLFVFEWDLPPGNHGVKTPVTYF